MLSLNTQTHAFINDGSTVSAGGNVQILAIDNTDSDIIGGAASLAVGASFGASAGMSLIDKDTAAFIGANAIVNAKALPAVALGGIEADSGVDVAAKSSEDVFGIMLSAGASLGAGLTAAINFALVDSDTRAAIEPNAQVNANTPGATAFQSVHVEATNDAKLFGVAGNFVVGKTALSGGVDVGLIRNDTEAIIDSGAVVRATKDVVVNDLATKSQQLRSGVGLTPVFAVALFDRRRPNGAVPTRCRSVS